MSIPGDRLIQAYREHFPKLEAAFNGIDTTGRDISSPLLVDLDAHRYFSAAIKLMIIGQQTNGWADSISIINRIEAIPLLLENYRDFHLGKYYTKTPFWAASHHLAKFVHDVPPDGGFHDDFIWSNLAKVDEKQKCPKQDILDVLMSAFPIVPVEISIAQPDVVVFFTGPDYDDLIETTFPETRFHAVGKYRVRELAVLENDRIPSLSFRTYHPRFLRMQKRGDLVAEILRTIRAEHGLSTITDEDLIFL